MSDMNVFLKEGGGADIVNLSLTLQI